MCDLARFPSCYYMYYGTLDRKNQLYDTNCRKNIIGYRVAIITDLDRKAEKTHFDKRDDRFHRNGKVDRSMQPNAINVARGIFLRLSGIRASGGDFDGNS